MKGDSAGTDVETSRGTDCGCADAESGSLTCRFHKFPQERIQQRILEEIVNVPVPQIQEQIVAVVKFFERRAVVQQLLTCFF